MFFNDNDSVFMFIKEILFEKINLHTMFYAIVHEKIIQFQKNLYVLINPVMHVYVECKSNLWEPKRHAIQ